MKKHYGTPLSTRKLMLGNSLYAFLLTCFVAGYSIAQDTCPDPGGGIRNQNFTSTTASNATLYPQSVPSGQSGLNRSTVGSMANTSAVTTTFPSNVITINPVLDNGDTGSVVLFFRNLWFGNAPNAELKIYRGTNTSGTLVATINASDSTIYTQTSASYTGPITLQFQSPVAGTSGNFNIQVRYWTGDQVFQSGFGRQAAVWTDFVQPNSATFIDDQRTTIPNSPYNLNTNPIAIARFDSNRQLISSELAFCMDSHLTNVGHGWGDYPGGTTFSYETDSDINNDGTIDASDQLKTAWLGWLMANRTTVATGSLRGVNDQVWSIIGGNNGAWSTAIPSLPTPVEPTFSISAPTASTTVGNTQTFTVNFNMTGNYAKRLKLIVPTGLTIQSVNGTGVTYSGGYINFASLPAIAKIQTISSTAISAELQVLYDETGFYNVNNFKIFVPCRGSTFQRFVGFKEGEVLMPHREASATWREETGCYDDEKITNGGFNGNANGWNVSGGGWQYVTTNGGEMQNQDNSGSNQILWQQLPTLTSQPYKLSFKLGSTDRDNTITTQTGSLAIRIGGITYATFNNATGINNNVTLTLANGATSDFQPYSSGASRIDNDVTIYIPHNVSLATAAIADQIHFIFSSNGDDFYLDNISMLGCKPVQPTFICSDSKLLYSGSPSGNTTLYDVNYSSNPLVRTSIGSASFRYNAVGFNPLNGYVYGIRDEAGANSNHLLRIGSDGTVEDLGAVTGLPTRSSDEYNSGDFGSDGYLYVTHNNSSVLYKIDIDNKTATSIALSPAASIAVSDIAYHNGLFYGVSNSNSQLISINPATGVVTAIGNAYSSGVFGAMMGACNGVFGIANSGGFYLFDLSTGNRTRFGDTPAALSGVDGAHCHTACIDLAPLPVKLVSFSVSKEASAANLVWITTEEMNSSHFDVEHSQDAKSWTSLASIKSYGESTVKKTYTYRDNIPFQGSNYYRLKMVDLDGTFAYSRINNVYFGDITGNFVFPNPVEQYLNLSKDIDADLVEIIDPKGVTVQSTGQIKDNVVNVEHLSPGIYLIKVTKKSGETLVQRIIKLN